MVVAGIAWIMCTPYGIGLLIGHWKRLNRTVARFVVPAMAVGWTAVLMVVIGVFFRQGDGGVTAALIAAPFVGFAFWIPVRGDGPDHDPPEPPDHPPPSGDRIEWDEFERARGSWSHETDRGRDRELEPV